MFVKLKLFFQLKNIIVFFFIVKGLFWILFFGVYICIGSMILVLKLMENIEGF